MKIPIRDAVFVTVSYADIFGYSLTKEEMLRWLVYVKRTSNVIPTHRLIHSMRKNGNLFYYFSVHTPTVSNSISRLALSKAKWEKAFAFGKFFKIIPTIEFVGVTGGLTMNNANKEDDIDLFFIVRPKTIWISRFLAVILTALGGARRSPGDTNVANKICLNMFMTQDRLALPKNEQDLFSAHEVLQMEPIWERNGVYKQFLSANRWVRTFLPNAWEEKVKVPASPAGRQNSKVKSNSPKVPKILFSIGYLVLVIPEFLLKIVQLWYMRNKRTNEVISDTMIRFHPHDARVWIREKLEQRLSKNKLPLDKIFYGR